MRRQVTVGGLVALALLTGSMVAFAQPPVPADCAPAEAGAEVERPGLVPGARAQDDPSGEEPEPVGDEPVGDEPVDDEPADDEPADDAPADDEPMGDEPAGDEPAGDDSAGDVPDADLPADDPCAAEQTAAAALEWGAPAREDDFDGPLDPAWEVYGGTGYDGQGTRTADALTTEDGVLTITGDAEGATGGMAWGPGQMYGRWEARVRTPASDPSYNALLLLWPDDETAAGSEVDFMEMLDPTRQTANAFLHSGRADAPEMGEVAVDATQWHNWAVEWTPTSITTYLDGVEWWTVDDPDLLPRGPMHLCVQLDWFPTGDAEVQESSMQVEWVREYAVDAPAPVADDPAAGEEPGAAAPAADDPDGDAGDRDTSGDDGDQGDGDQGDGDRGDGERDKDRGAGGGDSEGVPAQRLSEGGPDAPARAGLVPAAVRQG
ncbi:family 16 glycosylhydrolase [Pseudonocardia sp.]|uniref:glycoside hydrolase family 16 protein n=1 Tax=Pseudonocardia sp. TaxID=60912 RepID=UPI002609F8F4|nr:family 16 glycosylhydrolase [Pseudonocardia sp.]